MRKAIQILIGAVEMKKKKKRLTIKQIENAWIRRLGMEYPHLNRIEKLKILFDLEILKEKSKCIFKK